MRRWEQCGGKLDSRCGKIWATNFAWPVRQNYHRQKIVVAKAKSEGGDIAVFSDVRAAVQNADAVVTDTWLSMHDDASSSRHNLLAGYRVDEALMSLAKAGRSVHALFTGAPRREEVTAGVIDGPQSVVFDEAENRLHAQKGILAWVLVLMNNHFISSTIVTKQQGLEVDAVVPFVVQAKPGDSLKTSTTSISRTVWCGLMRWLTKSFPS